MQIKNYNIKTHKKTDICFESEQECISFLEDNIISHKKYSQQLAELKLQQDEILNTNLYIKGLVKIMKRKLGTNIQLIINSPLKLTLNGFFRF